MIQITTVGRVMADFELKKSNKNVPYLSFDIAVTKGYGNNRHTVFLQCWAFHEIAQRIESANVRKGSNIMISGDLDVVDFERKDGSKGKANKVIIQDWNFISEEKNHEKKVRVEEAPKNMEYQEHYCNDDDELPL